SDTPEQARHAADLVDITYDADPHDAAFRADHPAARLPEDPDSAEYRLGDADTALAGADVVIDAVYTTPPGAQQPHGATHHRRPVGRRRAHPVAVDARSAPRAGHDRADPRARARADPHHQPARRRRLRLQGD